MSEQDEPRAGEGAEQPQETERPTRRDALGWRWQAQDPRVHPGRGLPQREQPGRGVPNREVEPE